MALLLSSKINSYVDLVILLFTQPSSNFEKEIFLMLSNQVKVAPNPKTAYIVVIY